MTTHTAGPLANDTAVAPLVRHPELRELVRVARAYLAGQAHVSHVCATASYFHDAARFLPMGPDLKQMASEWSDRADRVWPASALLAGAVAEDVFRQWVAEQLSPFASVELPSLL